MDDYQPSPDGEFLGKDTDEREQGPRSEGLVSSIVSQFTSEPNVVNMAHKVDSSLHQSVSKHGPVKVGLALSSVATIGCGLALWLQSRDTSPSDI